MQLYSVLFISVDCSTCFRRYLHPLSGAQTTASTTSGTCQIIAATCHYRGVVGTDDGWRYCQKHVEQSADINKTV